MEKGRRILCFEDEAIIALGLKMDLLMAGYHVCGILATARDALEIVKRERPDLIIMDIQLVGHEDGIEAAKEILEVFPLPIIFMTGYPVREVMERAERLHPAAILLKPTYFPALLDAIEKVFSS